MSSQNTWPNDDGLEVRFGSRRVESERSSVSSVGGNEGELVLQFGFGDTPLGTSDVTANTSYGVIPSGSIVTDAYITVEDTLVGGTSFDIGLYTQAGVEIDADGLFDAVTLAEANAGDSARGHAGTNSGLLLDQPVASNAQVSVAATGTFTDGRVKVTVRYVLPSNVG